MEGADFAGKILDGAGLQPRDARAVSRAPAGPPDRPLGVHFDRSASKDLRSILTEDERIFFETDAASADLIIFGTDELSALKANDLIKTYRPKCITITETDIPTFALPGLYAANIQSILTAGRTETINYFISERHNGNAAVKSLVGKPQDKRYLYTFLGGSNSWARKRLFRLVPSRDDTLLEPTNAYKHWSPEQDAVQKEQHRRRYAEIMAQSKFTICPRGCGLSSYRLFESMSLGVAPVIIADGWRPIEDVDWSFALFVPEARLGQIDEIIRAHEHEWQERGQAARRAYESLLAPPLMASLIRTKALRVAGRYNPVREAIIAPVILGRVAYRRVSWAFYSVATRLALEFFRASRIPLPFVIQRPIEADAAKSELKV